MIKNAVDLLREIRRREEFEKFWSFILIVEGMVNETATVHSGQENRLTDLLKDAGREFMGMDNNEPLDSIWSKARLAALPVATWLNTCR